MILLIDAGNTRSKACQLLTDGISAPQELNSSLLDAARGGKAIISCVASAENRQALAAKLHDYKIDAEWLRSPAKGLGITNAYPQAERLGIDRFLALAAAYHQAQTACLVIDAGTAITVDLCDAKGQHLGGMIAPGLQALSQALRPNTDLPWVEAHEHDIPAFADNTEQALQLGALNSAVGLIEHAYNLACRKPTDPSLFLTGGAAATLLEHLEIPAQLEPSLVFQGIELYARRNSW